MKSSPCKPKASSTTYPSANKKKSPLPCITQMKPRPIPNEIAGQSRVVVVKTGAEGVCSSTSSGLNGSALLGGSGGENAGGKREEGEKKKGMGVASGGKREGSEERSGKRRVLVGLMGGRRRRER
ncbi:hypothetical protein L6452_09437 [Arctium lappa]|uniref:Uncharacterized protein n=1 Tax=Arctium lappa TaxID=4217 RepID=A0ACB9DKN6_ARCLA|nr:hypothetical protein L6452_09437 [Arctium lappa]